MIDCHSDLMMIRDSGLLFVPPCSCLYVLVIYGNYSINLLVI